MAHQVPHHFQEVRERLFPVDEEGSRDVARADQVERLPNGSRGVMKGRFASDLGVMQKRRVEFHPGVVGAAAEEVHRAAAPHRAHGPLPSLRLADGFDGDVDAAGTGHSADRLYRIGFVRPDDRFVGAESRGALQLLSAAPDRNHAASIQLRQFHEHQADGSQPDNGDGVARPRGGFLKSAKHASQRLHQSGVLITDVFGDEVRVALDDPRRNPDILRVRAVVEQ